MIGKSQLGVLLACIACFSLPSYAAENGIHQPNIVAHRGGRKWAPENTMTAFRKSIAAGCYGIELDIHRCKSGELVVIHDETLERTTNGQGFVKDKTLTELKKLSAGAWYAKEFNEERLPTLAEVLTLIDGKLVLNIEIKNAPIAYAGLEDCLLKLLRSYKYPEKIIISSFDHEILQRIHQKAPSYKLAFLSECLFVDLPGYAKKVGATAWNPYFGELRTDSVELAHTVPLEVNVWTVNDPKQWRAMQDMKVESIITDDPVGLMEFYKSQPSN
ncbi:MAG: glycerophosphodiester phosphodiesterase [Candidatus Obscuribacterales bacterium]|nr:glycerophosphodiester phosphodiesterase [Candidatus Obscuribacterales bacterium]